MRFFSFLISIWLLINSCEGNVNGYVEIPRTKISIILPEGYKIIKSSTGIRKNDKEAILIKDLNIGNFYTVNKNVNKSTYEQQGYKVFSMEETVISGFHAKIFNTNSTDINLNNWIVYFGDSTFYTILVCTYSVNDKKIEEDLKEVLLSLKYNKNKQINPFEDVNFKYDATSTIFKFDRFEPDMYIFQPTNIANYKTNPIIMVLPVLYDVREELELTSKRGFNAFEKIGMYGIIVDSTATYKDEGADVLLKTGSCFNKTYKTYFYQLTIVKSDYCLMIHGFCDYDKRDIISEIKKFCKSIKIKN